VTSVRWLPVCRSKTLVATRAGALVGLLVIALLSACGGSGSTSADESTAATSGAAGPTSSAAATSNGSTAAATSAPPSSAAPTVVPTAELTTTITGGGTLAGSYRMSLWAHDVITDCGAHSYGAQIVAYFAAHPCRSATRRLWTVPSAGRVLALSVVSVSAQIGKVNENPDFQYAQQLDALENADGTGSVNDLLREGKRIAGAATSIPAAEVFSVNTEDGLVVIMDGWYLSGATNPKDSAISAIEVDLFSSDAAAPDS
jgi:hypothetical protein